MSRHLSMLLVVVGFWLMTLLTGCSGTTRTIIVRTNSFQQPQYVGHTLRQRGLCGPGTVYSCPPRVVPYYDGYLAPAPQYGPYGYSAAATAAVTPQVYVQPSPQQLQAPRRVVRVHPRRRAR